jgi:hypothetical protein
MVSTFEGWLAALSDAEREALHEYKWIAAEPLNTALREDADVTDEQVELVRQLDLSLSRFRLPEPILVYRGTGATEFHSLPVGSEFTDPAYVSTSLLRIVAEDMVHDYAPELREISRIVIPGGTSIGAYVAAPELISDLAELEILLPRLTRFRIVGQGPFIEMEVLLL